MNARHPWWYYQYFNEVFARTPDQYESEIRLLDHCCGGLHGRVAEVGAGVGGHAKAILRRHPNELRLYDIDPAATHVLDTLFAKDQSVTVWTGDGFSLLSDAGFLFDTIVVMYSVLLQVSTLDDFTQRLSACASALRYGGYLAFECIDPEIHRRLYPPGNANVLYRGPAGEVSVESAYGTSHLTILFGGTLDGQQIAYVVKLLSMSLNDLERRLLASGYDLVRSHDLSGDGRRRLITARASRHA